MAGIAPGSWASACVVMATDVTEFWVSGETITATQANALAADCLNAAGYCAAVTPTRSGTSGSTKVLYR